MKKMEEIIKEKNLYVTGGFTKMGKIILEKKLEEKKKLRKKLMRNLAIFGLPMDEELEGNDDKNVDEVMKLNGEILSLEKKLKTYKK